MVLQINSIFLIAEIHYFTVYYVAMSFSEILKHLNFLYFIIFIYIIFYIFYNTFYSSLSTWMNVKNLSAERCEGIKGFSAN